MKRNVTALLVLLGFLLAPAASAQFITAWERNATQGNMPSWFGDTTERGLAYGVTDDGSGSVNERFFVVSRSGADEAPNPTVRIIDANDGTDVGMLSTTGITGFLSLNDVGVSEDGIIYACNVAWDTSDNPFRCYRWDDEADEPTEVITYSTTEAERLGDKITVVGSVSDGTVTLWTAATDTNNVYRFESADGSSFTATQINLVNSAGSDLEVGSSPSVGPKGPGAAAFYVNGNGIRPRAFDASGLFEGEVPNDVVGTGSNAIRYFEEGSKSFILIYDWNKQIPFFRGKLVDVTDGPAAATLFGVTDNLGGDTPSGDHGDIDYRRNDDGTYTVFVLGANNGLSASTTNEQIPVELASFEAVADGRDVVLRWSTATETNNSGFEVQRLIDGTFQKVTFVAGAGTTTEVQAYEYRLSDLAGGTHRFRLMQIDFDGAFSYSPEVEVEVALAEQFVLDAAHPNPFRTEARFGVSVQEAQRVRIELFDALGRRVAVLHDGPLAANQQETFTIEGNQLPSGVYLYRMTGETFTSTRSVTLMK